MTASITERVAAGAAFLDSREPGWPDRVDLARLDISSPDDCIAGQLAPATSAAENWAGMCRAAGWEKPAGGADDVSLGLDAAAWPPDEGPAEHDALTAEWRRVTEARLAEAAGSAR